MHISKLNFCVQDYYIFICYSFFGLLAVGIGHMVGEQWENLADGYHYIALFENKLTQAPFGYRILTPFLAKLLPWSAKVNFGVVTLGSLSSTTGVLAVYLNRERIGNVLTFFTILFWVTSFPFIYNATTLVRADALMYLSLALVLLSARLKLNFVLIILLVVLGSLAHETMLIIIPILWFDKLFDVQLLGSRMYSYFELICISVVSILLVILTRLAIDVLPGGSKSYVDGIFSMYSYVIEYSGGWIKHMLRIYAAFGPTLLYAAFYAFSGKFTNRTLAFFGILFVAIGATFLATDTLRVMAIIIFPVIIFAARYLSELLEKGNRKTVLSLVVLQIFYSYIVYGHLRSFESSQILNGIAGFISILAFTICLTDFAKGKTKNLNIAFRRTLREK